MTHYFIIPGYQGSGPDHWQTWIETKQPSFHRIQQRDWDNPDVAEWAENIEKAIAGYDPQSVVLVAHSLGCHTVTEWYSRYNRCIKAALLVAPPDVDIIRKKLNAGLPTGSSIQTLPFRTTLVASTNDPWISIDKAESYARNWGSKFINIGNAGHINSLSGYGEWEQGYELLKELSAI